MPIIRKESPTYTVMPNHIINDQRLDWRHLGVLTYLLSKPDGWELIIDHLISFRSLGRDGVYRIIKDLKEIGYIRMVNLADGGVEYYIHTEATSGKSGNEPLPEKPDPENPTLVNTERTVITETSYRGGRFKKPTVSDVAEYCAERGNSVDPEAFIDFYEAKGWKIGKNTMKDWKAAVRTWEKRDGKNQQQSAGRAKQHHDKLAEIARRSLAEEGADEETLGGGPFR